MKPPIKPKPEDCCNSGCNPCIFDVYEKKLQLYNKSLYSGEPETDTTENGISQLEYTHFKLVQNLTVCESYKLLTFKKIKPDFRVRWKPGDHFLFKYTSGDVSCTRAYTPLQKRGTRNEYDFSIIVKIYKNGLVSNYLENLKEGTTTRWRGPYGSFELVPNRYERIIMLAQGTGIVAFISLIENIIDNEENETRIILYYCCRSKDQILFRDDLYAYKAYWNFKYQIFLSDDNSNIEDKYQEPIVQHRLTFEDLEISKPFHTSDQFLLCGSTQFMKDYEVLLRKDNSVKNVSLF